MSSPERGDASTPVVHNAGGLRGRALLIVALVLTGLSMRTAVTSVGAVLDPLQRGLEMSSAASGALTTLPVICFALIGAATPWMARRLDAQRLMSAALATMIIGLVARAAVSSSAAFMVLSVLALTGGAVANVLMPILVRRHFPRRIGRLTAAYVTALAVGQTLGAGLTVPVGSIGGGWRSGLASWAVLAAVALFPWLWTARGGGVGAGRGREGGVGGWRSEGDVGWQPHGALQMLSSRTAWALTIMFASQSFQAYDAFGWFAKLMSSHGVDQTSAGLMLASLSAAAIPASFFAPLVPPRHHRVLTVGLAMCSGASYVGLLVAPTTAAWAWMVLSGLGLGMFSLVLTMIGLRSRVTATTSSLSAFVQSIGYILAGTGPLLFGILHGATDGWAVPLVTMLAAAGISVLAGWFACAPRYVDDELEPAARRG